jgi:hypothetical protein
MRIALSDAPTDYTIGRRRLAQTEELSAADRALMFFLKNVNSMVLVNASALQHCPCYCPEVGRLHTFCRLFVGDAGHAAAFRAGALQTRVSWLTYPVGKSVAVWTEFSAMTGVSLGLLAVVSLWKIAGLLGSGVKKAECPMTS